MSHRRTASNERDGGGGGTTFFQKIFDGVQPPSVSLSYGHRSSNLSEIQSTLISASLLQDSPLPPPPVIQMSPTIGEVANNNNHENYSGDFEPIPTTVRDFIAGNRKFYRWACLTGIIMPDNSYQAKSFFMKYIVVKFRLWSFYLHFALLFHTIFMIAYLIYYAVSYKDSDRRTIVTIVESLGYAFQNILLYPAIVYLRREFSVKREEIDIKVYTEALNYAVDIGRKALIFFSILLFTFLALEIAHLDKGAFLSVVLVVGIVVFFTPTNFFLVGLLSFLIFEQRISLHTMGNVRNKIITKEFSYGEYFQARESIDKRDRETPINWLIFAAFINTCLAILLLFVIGEYGKQKLLFIFWDIFYILSSFGRQITVLFVILLEIVKVNEIADSLLKLLVKSEWIGKEIQRLNLYVAMKDCPMGSSIFYFRPSKFQLMVQIVSSMIGMGLAIFWAIIFA